MRFPYTLLQFEDYVLLRQLAKTRKTIIIQVATYVCIGCIEWVDS